MTDQIFGALQTSIGQFLGFAWYYFLRGGFVVFILIAVYILYQLYMDEIVGQWQSNIKWVFLHIKAPKENLVSTLSIEQIYTQLTASYSGASFVQKYVEGQGQLWFSLEIVSLGGKISYIVRVPEKFRDLTEAAFYAQYPDCEITEVDDYLKNVEYSPETSDFDLWGTEVQLVEDQAFPIKTYRDFEHPTAEEKIIDPLDGLLEGFGRMDPHEFYGLQLLIRPIQDKDWQAAGLEKFKSLVGDKTAKKQSLADIIIKPFDMIADFSWSALFGVGAKVGEDKKRELSNFTDIEKLRVNSLQRKISKPGFESKMRLLYIAPKDKQGGKGRAVTLGLGFLKSFSNEFGNKFKPRADTVTKLDYRISPALEEPFIKYAVNKRKDSIFRGYKNRSLYTGGDPYILNTEELATIYHLPLSVGSTVAPVEKTTFKKGQAPSNLPVGT